ncbi:IclR family transcriptional regulator [Gilvimarinus sp. SDUM040013]|uniref:IclR family transcriptional regulator n=1 Tax=Gilvimarinus gilvus TaxID=3058038 RepID=A0ABU4S4B8_9GAMM|nr:IclR family transcriptional regulator [Gilvimarinus sp. SDUM040013]MDO3384943.1 IclR family transcriptional regulator [Gilvimarinus sp. SDUM040013]MDX6851261.1 IclR family transcriptional regulator [Gilvimarinus sp. SDUM040013]
MSDKTPAKAVEDDGRKYKAPALEKGLDILELLASSVEPMTTSQMASKLGRSVSELFRMVLALEYRGYIVQSDDGRDGYILSNKLFTLGIARAPTKTLLEEALPVMAALSREVGQSCHLAVASGDQIVVVGRIESPGDLGFAVRIGYRRPMVKAASGRILYGFQASDVQEVMRRALQSADEQDLAALITEAAKAKEQGYVRTPSDFIDGVTDLSAPVMGFRGAVAALTVPHVVYHPAPCSADDALAKLRAAALKISSQLTQQSH